MALILPPRWTPIERRFPGPSAYWQSRLRFNVVPAGRRSLKTETAKRKLVRAALAGTKYDRPRFFAAAPTRDQAKRIYWQDLKDLSPPDTVLAISESDLCITYINGSELRVVGMDRPQRIEGEGQDGGVLDEYADMKPDTWTLHVRPALADRRGWCDFIGVPEGMNHYYDLYQLARAEMESKGSESEWAAFTWKSSEVLPESEVEAARRDLDPLSFAQEFEASFVNFQGRAYYVFDAARHCTPLSWDRKADLVFCFDFNVSPGVAVVAQEMSLPNGQQGTGIIGEVFIPQNSNTPAVCRRLVQDWASHEGRVRVYGDATGGARGSAQVQGSDWDLVRTELAGKFNGGISYYVPSHNPAERARINAVNSRLLSGDGTIRLMIDRGKVPNLVRDLDGVRLLEGGSGEIDKKHDPRLTHLSDALGYYVQSEFPTESRKVATPKVQGI